MRYIFQQIDRMSLFAAYLAQLLLGLLVMAMVYEVAARYLFNAPTIWAFDVSYMFTGAMVILGTAWTTRKDEHVRIDVFTERLPKKLTNTFNGIIYIFCLTPITAVLAWNAWRRAVRAIATGELESVSVWAPFMWPFFAALALGLTLLSLQIAVEGCRSLCGANSTEDTPDYTGSSSGSNDAV